MRAFGTVIQLDLQVAAVTADVLGGRPVVYTTFLAYDEVAHHSGVERPETLAVLRRVDRAIARIAAAVEHAPRPYRLVVLADHGQSQGATFLQRYDESLEQLVRRVVGDGAVAAATSAESDESRGQLRAGFAELGTRPGVTGRAAKAIADETDRQGALELGAGRAAARGHRDGLRQPRADLVPARARPRHAGADRGAPPRPDRRRFAPTRGSASCSSGREADGAVALGARRPPPARQRASSRGRTRWRRSARARPTTSAAPIGFATCPDIVVNSTYWADTDEVAAFEELVGSHGGLGGTQALPFVLHPAELPWPATAARSSARRRSTASSAAGCTSSATTATTPSAADRRPPRQTSTPRRRRSRLLARRRVEEHEDPDHRLQELPDRANPAAAPRRARALPARARRAAARRRSRARRPAAARRGSRPDRCRWRRPRPPARSWPTGTCSSPSGSAGPAVGDLRRHALRRGDRDLGGGDAARSATRSPSAVTLADGRVLVGGGMGSDPMGSFTRGDAAIFDPQTNGWTTATPMGSSRSDHSLTLLADGTVLAAGGTGGAFLASAERYDPAANSWTAVGAMPSPHSQHTATRLADGSVVVVGGLDAPDAPFGRATAAVTRFDPATGSVVAGDAAAAGSLPSRGDAAAGRRAGRRRRHRQRQQPALDRPARAGRRQLAAARRHRLRPAAGGAARRRAAAARPRRRVEAARHERRAALRTLAARPSSVSAGGCTRCQAATCCASAARCRRPTSTASRRAPTRRPRRPTSASRRPAVAARR